MPLRNEPDRKAVTAITSSIEINMKGEISLEEVEEAFNKALATCEMSKKEGKFQLDVSNFTISSTRVTLSAKFPPEEKRFLSLLEFFQHYLGTNLIINKTLSYGYKYK